MRILKCKGGDCPVRHKCVRCLSTHVGDYVKDIPYKKLCVGVTVAYMGCDKFMADRRNKKQEKA